MSYLIIFSLLIFLVFFVVVFHQKIAFYLINTKIFSYSLLKFNYLTYIYHLILDDSPNLIIAIDPDLKIIFFNKTAEKIFGINKKYILGKNFIELFKEYGVFDKSLLISSLETGKVYDVENLPIKGKDGERRFWGKFYPLITRQKKTLGAVFVAWDVKDRQVVGQEYINQEKFSVVKTLAAGTAHEIRNPLTAVKGFIQLLEKEKLKDSESKLFLNTALSEINRIEKIISDLLVLSQDKGLKKNFVNINYVVEKVFEQVAPLAYLNNISLIKQLNYDVPLILGDEEQLYFVLTNLVNNAFEAIGTNGVVTIETFFNQDVGGVGFKVSDTGPGIPEELIGKIFEPFFTTKASGTGLGLAICYRTIEEHQGKIKVYNKPSGGATFEVTLPLLLKNTDSKDAANCAS